MIGKSYDKSKELLTHLKLLKSIGSLDSQLNMADLADASALPALTMAVSVQNMEKVAEQADEIKKQEREELIADFIGAVSFLFLLWERQWTPACCYSVRLRDG